jgi:hypothetical protein
MWINESAKRAKRMRDSFNLNNVMVVIKDRLPPEVDPEFVLNYISARVPFYLTQNIEVIYIGTFPEMEEREINAYYENDAIYVTNQQEDEMEMIEDIIHEISHAVEQYNQEFIYSTGLLQKEFLGKRKVLFDRLNKKHKVPSDFCINFEFDQAIDDFLFVDVGYDALNQLCVGVFPSGYAATSVSEYWAKGFEELFLGDKNQLKQECPVLFRILAKLIKEMEENS